MGRLVTHFPLGGNEEVWFLSAAGEIGRRHAAQFLGVSSPESWEEVWKNHDVAYRQTRQISSSIAPILAWVRETELVAAGIVTEDFNEELLRSLIGELRQLTRERVEESVGRVQTLCATAGVAVG